MTTEHILIVGVTSLAGAVSFLFTLLLNFYRSVEKRLLECENDRVKLWERIAELEART